MPRITIIGKSAPAANENPHDSAVLQHVEIGRHFSAFVDSQRAGLHADGTFRAKGITDAGAVTLRKETEHILARCNPHNAVDNMETTHLAVGYVQSGKTMSFTGLTALALDNGYRMVVYLAGSKNNLLIQTAARLKKDLINNNESNLRYFKIHQAPTMSDLDQIVGNLYLKDSILLVPILKHHKHINSLTAIFKANDFVEAMKGETVIIIDDEADQASLNSFGRKNSKLHDEEDYERSSTYDAILKMRAALPGNSYVQYTATPQANILISIKDLLSPRSHTLLTPGEGYVGGKLYFGRGKGHDLFHGRLIQEIPEAEVFHKKKNNLNNMPKSLIDALAMHILAVAIVVEHFKKPGISFLSMMVHPDNTINCNKRFKRWIEHKMKFWRKLIFKPEKHSDKDDMINLFKKLYPKAVEFYKEEERPEFEEILPLIKQVLCSWKVYLVNTDKEAQTNIDWDCYEMHVLVGAEMLNRGFTVENLSTTYMPRYSCGPTNADTIQQRCRFFGYKREYIESCRVFLPQSSIENYLEYIDHEEELRSILSQCDNLAEAERKVLLSPRLRATRANVLPVSVVSSRLSGFKELQAYESKKRIEDNKEMVENFLRTHDGQSWEVVEYNTVDRTHRRLKLPVEEAVNFLDDFQFGNYRAAMLKAATIRYLHFLSEKEDAPLTFVYFYQMAFKRPADDLRQRTFDIDTHTVVPLATGRSIVDKEIYPGDREMVGQDSITIQLYHIILDKAPVEFAHDAYSIAINYPESLATNYVVNNQNGYDDDDDDD